MSNTKNDMVNHPKHYTSSKSGIEVIEVTRYLTGSLSNAWKYCCRYQIKGTPQQDLKKAIFYLKDFCNFPAINAYTCTDTQCKKLLEKMDKFIEVEEIEEIKAVLTFIRNMVNICYNGDKSASILADEIGASEIINNLDVYADAIGA